MTTTRTTRNHVTHHAAPKKILGVSCYFHDSAVAAVENGEIVFAIHEERLSRNKHEAGLPRLGIQRALDVAGWRAENVDRVVFYENPDWKLQRLRDQAERFRPDCRYLEEVGLPNYLQNKYPVEKLFREAFPFRDGVVTCGEHHRSHAAAAFYTSPFDKALVMTLDGVGEYESAAIFLGEGNALTRVRSINFPDSLGLFYSVFTQYLGFRVNNGEYKVMGLAPYGQPTLVNKILGEILILQEDGGFSLNLEYFNFCGTDRHYRDRLIDHLGIPPRGKGEPMTREHENLAASVQHALEEAVLNFLRATLHAHGVRDVCLAGGVALNCTANARIIRDLGVRLHIHPAAGDAGGALGAALYEYAQSQTNLYRPAFTPYLGVSAGDQDIVSTLTARGIPFHKEAAPARRIAERLAAGDVVAIVHGRDEWGPRALGARSILADPRRAEMKEHLNAKIKFREEFRPFAPVVLDEYYGDYFETLGMPSSPHMLYTHRALRPERIAAVVHVDGTSRAQTVNRQQNAYLYDIIREFYRLTDVPVIINTSFNLKGEPMVSSPADALKTFFASGIDVLAIEDYLVYKSECGYRDGT